MTSSTAQASASGNAVLRLTRLETDVSLDPATFYGNALPEETAIYQGLLQYKSNTNTIVPLLATAWSVSRDGKTYTFTIRRGVKFHDGTGLDAAAVKASFQRFIAIKGGPSYMLSSVTSMTVPAPYTLVVHLSQPVVPFLDYLCSPWGPKITSPTAIKLHAGKDYGQTWLQTHDAGTGPYELTARVENQYDLITRFPGYWGPQPYYKAIKFTIIPNVNTQIEEFEQSQLDIISNLDAEQNDVVSHLPGVKVDVFPTIQSTLVLLNPATAIFKDINVRKAIMESINARYVTQIAHGVAGTVPTQFTPYGMLPKNLAQFSPPYDPSALLRLHSLIKRASISIRYDPQLPDAEAAALIQAELQAGGLNANVAAMPEVQFNNIPTDPSLRPDIVVGSFIADAANPGIYFQEFMKTGGSLDYLGLSLPKGDAIINKGLSSTNPASAYADWNAAAKYYASSYYVEPITDLGAVVAVHSDIKSVQHSLMDPFNIEAADTQGTGA